MTTNNKTFQTNPFVPALLLTIAASLAMIFTAVPAAAAEGGLLQHLLAPGEFSAAHKEISGIKNCGKCHSIGTGVASEKCLACHKEINKRLQDSRGNHGRFTKECVTCHKEHGKPLISFDRKAFDHRRAIFPRAGAHRKVDCGKCHLRPAKAGGKRFTYIGLPTDCGGCHPSPHEPALAACTSCHAPTTWKQTTFDHGAKDAPFPLTGLHRSVTCGKCHSDYTAASPRKKLDFSRPNFSRCTACHQDRHQGKLPADCLRCHSMKGWKPVSFDHDRSRFPLRGPHAKLACAACHKDPAVKGLPTDCGGCHQKTPHRRPPTPCTACHQQQGWSRLRAGAADLRRQRALHRQFSYPLNGAHATVACAKCHQRGPGPAVYFQMRYDDCSACHQDKHHGQLPPPCGRCHVVEGFKKLVDFDHARTGFDAGALHGATACEKCHPNQRYKGTPRACYRCHLDIARYRRGVIGTTAGELISPKARIVPCSGCHQAGPRERNGLAPTQRPKVTAAACISCHNEVYGRFFEQWRQLFAAEATGLRAEMDALAACGVKETILAPKRQRLDFVEKNLEHNYRFSGALTTALGRELAALRQANCRE